ncbi:hypothetical protein RYH80_06590 [Halobaculum sp. MBLA0147]|uniref:hypothetical protein n=1 Tax=Halobaculum sp. MBLA0147 TaxID=3079934 RepID=UPI0035235392
MSLVAVLLLFAVVYSLAETVEEGEPVTRVGDERSEERLRTLESRLAGLERQFDEFDSRLDRLEDRTPSPDRSGDSSSTHGSSRVEDRLSELDHRVAEMSERHGRSLRDPDIEELGNRAGSGGKSQEPEGSSVHSDADDRETETE